MPALLFGAGAAGFFAVPYTIIVYPIVFVVLPRLWSVRHVHGYVTPGRLRPGPLRLAAARAADRDHRHRRDDAVHRAAAGRHRGRAARRWASTGARLPIIVAFAILAAYTYQSGLRAPALIAFVKDTLIYLVIIVAVIYIPSKLGGWGDIFDAAAGQVRTRRPNPGDGILLARRRRSCSTPPWRSARRSRCSSTRTR